MELKLCYFCLVLGITLSYGSSTFLDAVSRVKAKGKSVYIPVKRDLLQGMIDAFTGPTLYMPDGPVMSGQPEGTHPIWVDVAEVTFKDFVEDEASNPNSYVSTVGMEITVTIPFLSVKRGGPTNVNLGVAVLYDGHRRGIPQPDFLYTYYPVEQIIVKGDHVTVIDADSQMTIDVSMDVPCSNVPQQAFVEHVADAAAQLTENSEDVQMRYMRSINAAELLKRLSDSAKGDDAVELLKERDGAAVAVATIDDAAGVLDDTAAVLSDIEDDIDGAIFTLGAYPYVDFCWFYKAFKPRFCLDVGDIRYAQAVHGGNVCAMWSSVNEEYCETVAGMVTVSGWFKYLIPIDTATQTLGADQYNGDYSIGMKYPCKPL